MADIWVTAFLPDGWTDFATLLETIACPGAALYRWEEDSFEDGSRRRAVHLIRSDDGPTIDAIRSFAIDRARQGGFRFTRLEDGNATTILTQGDRALRVGPAPLPPRGPLDLADRVARRGAAEFPALVDPFRLAAIAGAATLERVHRFAELDLEMPSRFGAPTTRARTRGAYDAAALCKSLEADGWTEDGDRWVREETHNTCVVRLRDGAVEIEVAPRS